MVFGDESRLDCAIVASFSSRVSKIVRPEAAVKKERIMTRDRKCRCRGIVESADSRGQRRLPGKNDGWSDRKDKHHSAAKVSSTDCIDG